MAGTLATTMTGGHLAPASRARAARRHLHGEEIAAGVLLPVNRERAVHLAGIVAGAAVTVAGILVARVENLAAVKFGTVAGESLAGGAQLQVVERVENQAAARFGTAVGESLAGGAQLQIVARVENQVVVIVDGAVAAAVDGVHLGNLERARARNQRVRNQRARKRNLPRVDVGAG